MHSSSLPPSLNFKEDRDRTRLPARATSISPANVFPFNGAILFVLIGLVLGVFALAGKPDKNQHTVGLVAAMFTLVGAYGLATVLLSPGANPKSTAREMPDYPWDHTGFVQSPWPKFLLSLCRTLLVSGFFMIIPWFLSKTPSSLLTQLGNLITGNPGGDPLRFSSIVALIFAALLGLASLLSLGSTILELVKAVRFGSSRIEFDSFPLALGKPAGLRWISPVHIPRTVSGTFALRCISETLEVRQRGKHSTHLVIHDALWSGIWTFENETEMVKGSVIDLKFVLPANCPPTDVNAVPAIYWELEVKLQCNGPDFESTYLVPVYKTT